MKYKLSYSEKDSENDVEELIFSSAKKRAQFIDDKTIFDKKGKVFVLGIKTDETQYELFIFDTNNLFLEKAINNKWTDMFLFEWKSYEDAYAFCLDMKEVHELCYND